MSDMDLLLLEREDIYDLDSDFKAELVDLFSKSASHLARLRRMLLRGHAWLRDKFKTFFRDFFHDDGRPEAAAAPRRFNESTSPQKGLASRREPLSIA